MSLEVLERRDAGEVINPRHIAAFAGGGGARAAVPGMLAVLPPGFSMDVYVGGADDGGGSGLLRKRCGILGVGDGRNVVAALAITGMGGILNERLGEEKANAGYVARQLERLAELMTLHETVGQYKHEIVELIDGTARLAEGLSTLKGQVVGNLLFAYLIGRTSDGGLGMLFNEALGAVSGMVGIDEQRVRVRAISDEPPRLHLIADDMQSDSEAEIDKREIMNPADASLWVTHLEEDRPIKMNAEARHRLTTAKYIIGLPGSLFTSSGAIMACEEFREALAINRELGGKYAFGVNLEAGRDTQHIKSLDQYAQILSNLGGRAVDLMLLNSFIEGVKNPLLANEIAWFREWCDWDYIPSHMADRYPAMKLANLVGKCFEEYDSHDEVAKQGLRGGVPTNGAVLLKQVLQAT